MPVRTSLNVSLTPRLERFVHARVAAGRYQTASEVVREGLRLLERQEREHAAALKSLRTRLRHGAAQAERGELIDGDEVFKEIRTMSAKRRKG